RNSLGGRHRQEGRVGDDADSRVVLEGDARVGGGALDGTHERRMRDQAAERAAAVEVVAREARTAAEADGRESREIRRVAGGRDVEVDDDGRREACDERESATEVKLLLRRESQYDAQRRRALEQAVDL